MVAQLLPQFDYLMMLDADIGVLNPKRRLIVVVGRYKGKFQKNRRVHRSEL